MQKLYLANNSGKPLDEVPEYGSKNQPSAMMKTPKNSKKKQANGKTQSQVKSDVQKMIETVNEDEDQLRLRSMDDPTNLILSETVKPSKHGGEQPYRDAG